MKNLDDEIMTIVEKSGYNPKICAASFAHLKSEDKKMSIMEKSGYVIGVCISGVAYLKSEENILTIIKKTNYNRDICRERISLLKKEENILFVMEGSSFNPDVCACAISELKNVNKIKLVMKKTNYNSSVCIAGIGLLKTEKDILHIMKKTDYNAHVCRAGISNLKIREDILSVMEKTNYEDQVCLEGISNLKLENDILNIVIKGIDNNYISMIGLKKLKLKESVMSILRNTEYAEVIREGFKILKADADIMEILSMYYTSEYLYTAGIEFINSIENVQAILSKSGYSSSISIAGIKRISSLVKLEELIEDETLLAKMKFESLISLVHSRYEALGSTLVNSPDQLKSFKEHNAQVLELCIERGVKKGLSRRKLNELEVAAILHDIAKADNLSGNKAVISNYVLAAHGEMAAEELPDILSDHPDIITKILGEKYSNEDILATTKTIQKALRCHMGPHPGFMDFVLSDVNSQLKKIGEPLIKHPRPAKGDVVSEILLASDMYSLADRKGREKVLAIRSAVPMFKEQDQETCSEYMKLGIHLSLGEAALLSGFDSAYQARNMIKNIEDYEWINSTIKESMLFDYRYQEETVNYLPANKKREAYLLAKFLMLSE